MITSKLSMQNENLLLKDLETQSVSSQWYEGKALCPGEV